MGDALHPHPLHVPEPRQRYHNLIRDVHEFFRKAIDRRPRHGCLRLPLLPLTIGHLFFLHEIDSPVVGPGANCLGDLLLAVLVCAQPHEEARRMLTRRGGHWRLSLLCYYWGWRCRHLDLPTEAAKFSEYLRDEQATPPLQPVPRSEARPIGAPWPWMLFEFVRWAYKLSAAEALNVTMREAAALWAIRADAEGRVTLATSTGGLASAIHSAWRASHPHPVQN
jgi:hypothetical protein